MAERTGGAGPHIRGGGGIGSGPLSHGLPSSGATSRSLATTLRNRWVAGVAVVSVLDEDGGFRGVSVSSVVVVSIEPPIVALALSSDGSVHRLFVNGTMFAISMLDRSRTFPADRFAGRAPVPDAAFTGVPHVVHASGVPVIEGAIGWCVAAVTQVIPAGDHVLILGEVQDGATPEDTDDPLVTYEGRYRALEAE